MIISKTCIDLEIDAKKQKKHNNNNKKSKPTAQIKKR